MTRIRIECKTSDDVESVKNILKDNGLKVSKVHDIGEDHIRLKTWRYFLYADGTVEQKANFFKAIGHRNQGYTYYTNHPLMAAY